MKSLVLSIVTLLLSFHSFSQIKPANDDCSQAFFVKLDTFYQQKDLLPNLDSIPFCGQQKRTLRGVWYEINGNDSILFIHINSENTSAFIIEGSCSNLSCIDNFNYFRPISGYIEKGKTYKIFIYSELSTKADYSVTFSAFPIVEASKCETALTLDCGSELNINSDGLINSPTTLCNTTYDRYKYMWFRIRGNGGVQTIRYNSSNLSSFFSYVYDTTCSDSMLCVLSRPFSNEVSFITELNKDYLIQAGLTAPIIGPVSVTLECAPLEPQFTCDEAKNLSCGDRYENEQLENIYINTLNPEINKAYGLWYKLPSVVGKRIQLQFDGSNYGNMQVKLFKSENGDCTQLEQIYYDFINVSDDKFYLDIIDDEQYYMLLSDYTSVPFNLSVTCLDIDYDNNTCQKSEQINICGDTLSLFNSFCLDKTDANLPSDFSRSGKWFKFTGGGKPIKISADFNGQIPIFIYESSCGEIGEPISWYFYQDQNNNISNYFNVVEGQEYYIRVNYDNSNNLQDYNLYFGCLEANLDGLRCEDALELVCGIPTLIRQDYLIQNLVTQSSCGSINGYSWFKVEGDGGTKSISGDNVYRVAVYKSSDCKSFECWAIPGFQNYVTFPTEAGFTYYCIVYGGDPSSYVNMSCVDENTNDTCSKATPISCDESGVLLDFRSTFQIDSGFYSPSSLWYQIQGEDRVVKFNTQNYSNIRIHNSCNIDTIYRPAGQSFSLFLTQGEDYFIEIFSSGNPLDSLILACRASYESNNTCETAQDVVCGSTFTLNLANSLSTTTNNSQDTIYYPYKSAWYQFVGDGQVWIFSPMNLDGYSYEIYEDDCDQLPTISLDNYYSNAKFVVNSEVGKNYKIRLKLYSDISFVNFNVECAASITNFNCERATTINCDTTVTLKPQDVSQDVVFVPEVALLKNVRWYILESNDDSYLKLESSYGAGIVFESNANCDSLKQILRLFGSAPVFLERKENMTYYLAIGNFNYYAEENDVTFQHYCVPDSIETEIYGCNIRTILECGNQYNISDKPSLPSTFNNCTASTNGPWFEVLGTGSYFQLKISGNANYFSSTSVIVGEGNNCEDVQCTCILPVNQLGIIGFQSEAGKRYFIKISHNYLVGLELESIQFTCFDDMNNQTCAEAISVTCGQTVNDVISISKPADTINVCQTINKGNYYIFEGTGDNITFEFSNISSGQLSYEIIENSCLDGRCLFTGAVEANFYSRNQFTIDTKSNASYIIKLHSQVDCAYEFSTSCFEIHENVSCQSADLLQCGKDYDLNLQSPLGLNIGSICGGTAGQIEHWFQLPKNKKWFEFRFDATHQNENISIAYLKGSCNGIQCVQNWDYTSDAVAVYGNNDDDYYVKITRSYNGQNLDDIKFSIACIEGKPNDFCENATLLYCGFQDTLSTYLSSFTQINENCSTYGNPDIWYKLLGNDSVFVLNIKNTRNYGSITAYSASDCSNLKCDAPQSYLYQSDNNFAIPTAKDSIYYIRLQNASSNDVYKFEMNVNCLPRLENDFCSGAIAIDLTSDTIIANILLASGDLPELNNCNQNFVYPITNGLWYTFEGNGGVTTISKTDQSNPIRYIIFEGSCDQWQCIENDVLYNNTKDIVTELGKSYKMVVYSSDNSVQTVSFQLKKKILAENWECSGAEEIGCEAEIIMDKSKLLYSNEVYCNTYGGHSSWHSIESDTALLLKLNSIIVYNQLAWLVYDSCMDFCRARFDLPYSGGSTQILVPKGHKYLIESRTDLQNNSEPFIYKISCLENGYKHTSFETALDLKCGKQVVNLSKTGYPLEFEIEELPLPLLFYKFVSKVDTNIRYVAYGSLPFRAFIYNTETKQFTDFSTITLHQIKKDIVYYLLIDYSGTGFENNNYEFEILGLCSTVSTSDTRLNTALIINPNPFIQYFEMQLSKTIEINSKIEILDVVGNIIKKIDLSDHVGNSNIIVAELENIANGIYYVKYISPSQSKTVKIIKMGRN
ncbi:MAG TPA: T9SS type A sorting domain-containing protein [Saprospiraceae bacterium]|nr:T9SS type A sorting domain-containing protein [Saprospiraceae bacterium]